MNSLICDENVWPSFFLWDIDSETKWFEMAKIHDLPMYWHSKKYKKWHQLNANKNMLKELTKLGHWPHHVHVHTESGYYTHTEGIAKTSNMNFCTECYINSFNDKTSLKLQTLSKVLNRDQYIQFMGCFSTTQLHCISCTKCLYKLTPLQ